MKDHRETAEILYHLNQTIAQCSSCPLNQQPYNPGKPVPGFGVLRPKLMIVGEGPGKQESEIGKPFVGRSGQLLQQALHEARLSVPDLYITNVVKHRPPDNRNPTEQEIKTCISSYLKKEIVLTQPQSILCVGKVPSNAVAQLAGVSLPSTGLRGLEYMYKNIPVFCTWHPAYVLRNPSKFKELLEDIYRAIGGEK